MNGKPFRAIPENGISKDLNYRVECQRRAISHSYVLLAATVNVPPVEEFFDFQKSAADIRKEQLTWQNFQPQQKNKLRFLPPSWYPFHEANDLRFWYFRGSCQELLKWKNIGFVGFLPCGRDSLLSRRTREETNNKNKINYLERSERFGTAAAAWRILYKHVINDKRKTAGPDGGVLYLSEGSLDGPLPTSLTPDTRKR